MYFFKENHESAMLMGLCHWRVIIVTLKYVVELCISIYLGSGLAKTLSFLILLDFQDSWTISQKPTFDLCSNNLGVNS